MKAYCIPSDQVDAILRGNINYILRDSKRDVDLGPIYMHTSGIDPQFVLTAECYGVIHIKFSELISHMYRVIEGYNAYFNFCSCVNENMHDVKPDDIVTVIFFKNPQVATISSLHLEEFNPEVEANQKL
jgi:hypothetical protein